MSGKSRPCWSCRRRAVMSCCSELSIPTTRAPRRASHAETYAVPHPSSIASFPIRSSGSMRTSVSGTCHIPQRGVSWAQLASPSIGCFWAYASHFARFLRTCSGRSLTANLLLMQREEHLPYIDETTAIPQGRQRFVKSPTKLLDREERGGRSPAIVDNSSRLVPISV